MEDSIKTSFVVNYFYQVLVLIRSTPFGKSVFGCYNIDRQHTEQWRELPGRPTWRSGHPQLKHTTIVYWLAKSDVTFQAYVKHL